MEPGKHLMKLSDYGVSQTSGGHPQAYAQFSKDGETVTWYGGMNATVNEGKTKSQWDVTLANLQTLGYQGDTSPMGVSAKLYDGPMDAALTMGEYELVLEKSKDWKNDAGVMQTGVIKVKYINKPGEGGGVGKKFASKEEMMAAFAKPSGKPSGSSTEGEKTGAGYF